MNQDRSLRTPEQLQQAGLVADAGPLRAVAATYAVAITDLEGKVDKLHDQGLKALFLTHRHTDPMAFTVGAEIYGHLERVADRFEDVANEISGIVIEHV